MRPRSAGFLRSRDGSCRAPARSSSGRGSRLHAARAAGPAEHRGIRPSSASLNQILGADVMLWGTSVTVREPGQVHRWHVDVERSRHVAGCDRVHRLAEYDARVDAQSDRRFAPVRSDAARARRAQRRGCAGGRQAARPANGRLPKSISTPGIFIFDGPLGTARKTGASKRARRSWHNTRVRTCASRFRSAGIIRSAGTVAAAVPDGERHGPLRDQRDITAG